MTNKTFNDYWNTDWVDLFSGKLNKSTKRQEPLRRQTIPPDGDGLPGSTKEQEAGTK